MAIMMQLRAKFETSKKNLENAKTKSDAVRKVVSSSNRNQLEDLLIRHRSELQPQDYVELIELLGECPFLEEDLEALCGRLEPPKQKKGKKEKGEKLSQDYVNFHVYLSDAVQDIFLAGTYEADALQELLFKILKQMGLENGDELTYKRMTSFLLALTEPKEKVDSMSAKTKWLLKNHVRDMFLKQTEPVVNKCMHLPVCTATFLTEHPQLYKNVLGKEVPTKCRIDMSRVVEIDKSFTCRNEGSSGRPMGLNHGQQPQVLALPSTHGENNLMQSVSLIKELLMPYVMQSVGCPLRFTGNNAKQPLQDIFDAAPRSRPSGNLRRALTFHDEEAASEVSKQPFHKDEQASEEQHASEDATQQAPQNSDENSPQQAPQKSLREKPSVSDILVAVKDRTKERADERKAAAKAKDKELAQSATLASQAQGNIVATAAAEASASQPSAASQAQRNNAAAREPQTKYQKKYHRMLQESASQAAEKESTQAAGSKQLTPQAAKKGSTQATGSKQSTRQAAEKGSTLATGSTPAKKREQATVSSESPRKKPRLYQKTVDADSILKDGSKIRITEPKMQHETVERKKA